MKGLHPLMCRGNVNSKGSNVSRECELGQKSKKKKIRRSLKNRRKVHEEHFNIPDTAGEYQEERADWRQRVWHELVKKSLTPR